MAFKRKHHLERHMRIHSAEQIKEKTCVQVHPQTRDHDGLKPESTDESDNDVHSFTAKVISCCIFAIMLFVIYCNILYDIVLLPVYCLVTVIVIM